MNELKKKEEEDQRDQQEFYAGGNDSRTGGGSGLATLGPPSDDPFSKLVHKAADDMKSGNMRADEDKDVDELKLALYRNGFTVDDGPLRDLENPANAQFVDDLMRGFLPEEVLKKRKEEGKAARLNVNVIDKRSELYRAPTPPPYVAFGGEGSSLGSAKVASGGALIDPASEDMQGAPPALDTTEPTTLLQVKLADGKKMKAKLNKHHTVQDLVAMIRNRDGGSGGTDAPYFLCAGFPPKDVTDLSLSLQDAGLVGASIVQKTA